MRPHAAADAAKAPQLRAPTPGSDAPEQENGDASREQAHVCVATRPARRTEPAAAESPGKVRDAPGERREKCEQNRHARLYRIYRSGGLDSADRGSPPAAPLRHARAARPASRTARSTASHPHAPPRRRSSARCSDRCRTARARSRIFVRHLLGRAHGQRTARRAQRLVLGPARRWPSALTPDPVHHRQIGGAKARRPAGAVPAMKAWVLIATFPRSGRGRPRSAPGGRARPAARTAPAGRR